MHSQPARPLVRLEHSSLKFAITVLRYMKLVNKTILRVKGVGEGVVDSNYCVAAVGLLLIAINHESFDLGLYKTVFQIDLIACVRVDEISYRSGRRYLKTAKCISIFIHIRLKCPGKHDCI